MKCRVRWISSWFWCELESSTDYAPQLAATGRFTTTAPEEPNVYSPRRRPNASSSIGARCWIRPCSHTFAPTEFSRTPLPRSPINIPSLRDLSWFTSSFCAFCAFLWLILNLGDLCNLWMTSSWMTPRGVRFCRSFARTFCQWSFNTARNPRHFYLRACGTLIDVTPPAIPCPPGNQGTQDKAATPAAALNQWHSFFHWLPALLWQCSYMSWATCSPRTVVTFQLRKLASELAHACSAFQRAIWSLLSRFFRSLRL